MIRKKSSRNWILLEHKSKKGTCRYATSKNRRNTPKRLQLKKYSSITQQHELFSELK